VSDRTSSGVYHTEEPDPAQRGFVVRRPDPPLLVRPAPVPDEE
jgi:hypothetical protein